jgi:arabinogalactan endo-1,4-beta-galactosidase
MFLIDNGNISNRISPRQIVTMVKFSNSLPIMGTQHFNFTIQHSRSPFHLYKPSAWKGLPFTTLKDSVYAFTKKVVSELKAQGTTPDMVQIGNEINHGMIWPEGHIGNLDSLAQLIQAGIAGVEAVDPSRFPSSIEEGTD